MFSLYSLLVGSHMMDKQSVQSGVLIKHSLWALFQTDTGNRSNRWEKCSICRVGSRGRWNNFHSCCPLVRDIYIWNHFHPLYAFTNRFRCLAATQPPSMWHLHSWSESCLKSTEKCFALITILVKCCLTNHTTPSGAKAGTFPRRGEEEWRVRIHATFLIKNKKVAMLFVQTTGIFYPESRLGDCVFATDRHDTHMHATLRRRAVISRSVNYFKEGKKGSLILLNWQTIPFSFSGWLVIKQKYSWGRFSSLYK